MNERTPGPVPLSAATEADWPETEALLVAAGLPTAGARDHLGAYLILRYKH